MSYPVLDKDISGVSDHYAELLHRALDVPRSANLVEETLSPKEISDADISRIHEIEQDAWAHGINEYLMCTNCRKVVGKESIYGRLPAYIQKRTVSRIEKLLGGPLNQCDSCGKEMEAIYGKKYAGEIKDRYTNSVSYVSVLRDHDGVIQGFIDAYVDDFPTIFTREFAAYYYPEISVEDMKSHIEISLGKELPDMILFWTSVALSERYRNLGNIYRLLKIFFMSMDGANDYMCLSEARVGTNMSQIYLKMGAKSCKIGRLIEEGSVQGKALGVENEIYLQENIAPSYNEKLQMPAKDFWRFCFR